MKKNLIFTLFFFFFIYASGYANLYINEVNSIGKWIEIYNSSDEDWVNVKGYILIRNNNDGDIKFSTIQDITLIPPRGFLVLYRGSEAPPPTVGSIGCLTFGISADKLMSVVLMDAQGNVIDDTFDIGNPQTVTVGGEKSWARETDGATTIVALNPTPEKSNTAPPSFSDLKIYINEVNSTGKWIEIYNDEDHPVNVGKFTVTRNNNTDATSIVMIPPGTSIPSKGFLALYQGTQSGGTAPSPVNDAIDCLTYGISADKFMSVVLKDDEGNIVDNTFDIGYPQRVTVHGGKSWARETDGDATIVAQEPTPGTNNTGIPLHSDLKVYVNEVNSTGKWIEIYNDEDVDVDVSGYTVIRSNNDNATGFASIPEATPAIPSKGFLVLYEGVQSGGVSSAPIAGAIDCLTYGISTDKFMSVILKDRNNYIVDNTFDIGYSQTVTVSEGKSWARETDGAPTIVAQEPTPGGRNYSPTNLILEKSENALVFVSAGTLWLPEKASYIQLYSASGKLVLDKKVTETSIDLTNLPEGFYVVKLTVSGKLFVQKIIL